MIALERDYDIVIAGGGPVGMALALALQHTDIRIALVDSTPPDVRFAEGFDSRCIALSSSSQKFFSALGVWPALEKSAMTIQSIFVSDKGHFGKTELHAAEAGLSALGYTVPMQAIQSELQQACKVMRNLDSYCPGKVEMLNIGDEFSTVSVEYENKILELRSKLVVAADGSQSTLRQQRSIQASNRKYDQFAVVTNIQFSKPSTAVAYERFTQNGPIAVLPITDNRSALVLTVPANQVDRIKSFSDAEFISYCQEAFGWWCGEITRVGVRQAFPLQLVQANEKIQNRFVLLGNSAQTLHPAAGQGFNLALRDVAELAEVVVNAVSTSEDIGQLTVLRRYDEGRKGDRKRVIEFTDHLVRMFTSTRLSSILLRNLGLVTLDWSPMLRYRFISHLLSGSRPVPKLLLGLPLT